MTADCFFLIAFIKKKKKGKEAVIEGRDFVFF